MGASSSVTSKSKGGGKYEAPEERKKLVQMDQPTEIYLTNNDPEGQINQQEVSKGCGEKGASGTPAASKEASAHTGNSPAVANESGKECPEEEAHHVEKRSEFLTNLEQGKIQKPRDKKGFMFRRSATAQRIVEDPDNKEVFQKRRTTVYASTEMGIKQEFHAPFPPHILGTFSCHGIAPAEDEEPDDMLRMLGAGGPSGGVHQKVNQDRGCVVYPVNGKPEEAFLAVFDGHGDQGDRVAEFVMRDLVHRIEKGLAAPSAAGNASSTTSAPPSPRGCVLPDGTSQQSSTALTVGSSSASMDTAGNVAVAPTASRTGPCVDPSECMKASYKATNQALKAEKAIKAMASGTTVVSVYVKGDTLYVANVGDSRAVMAVSRGDVPGDDEEGGAEGDGAPLFSPGRATYAGGDIIGAMSPVMSTPGEGSRGLSLESSPGQDQVESAGQNGTATPPLVTSHSTRITKTVPSNVAVMARCEPCDAFMMTIDHKPDDPVEMERITSSRGHVSVPTRDAGGRTFAGQVTALSGTSVQIDGRSSPSLAGTAGSSRTDAGSNVSARVWLDPQHTLVGLAMSRSIGDFAVKTVGVIAEPDVYVHKVSPKDRFLILASDGVWEFIDNQEAVNIVQSNLHLGAFTACQVLIQQAEKRWRENEGDYRDDITAIVLVFPFFSSACNLISANAE